MSLYVCHHEEDSEICGYMWYSTVRQVCNCKKGPKCPLCQMHNGVAITLNNIDDIKLFRESDRKSAREILDNPEREILFDNLFLRLRNEGYKISCHTNMNGSGIDRFGSIESKNLVAHFCTQSTDPLLDGRLGANNSDLYWREFEYGLSLPLPRTEKQFQYLLQELKYLVVEDEEELPEDYVYGKMDYPDNL